jgi:hypothetical protein
MKLHSVVSLLGAAFLSSALGFSTSNDGATKQISWPEYKHDFIDPISSQHQDSHLEGHMDPAKRQVSDQYWFAQFAEDKEKLHRSNKAAAKIIAEEEEEMPGMATPTTSYNAYKTNHIDPMEKRKESKSDLKGNMDPNKRANADQFWLQAFLEEKAKLHGNQTP